MGSVFFLNQGIIAYLAGMRIFLVLDLTADPPQEAEHDVQSLQSDHKQSVGKTLTLMEDSVVEVDINETELDSSLIAG